MKYQGADLKPRTPSFTKILYSNYSPEAAETGNLLRQIFSVEDLIILPPLN